ncbi:M1 family metallopeptidase [Salibacteraceae bacterium]|nr:M1 family metallopeptidase [Salibacteraceae bacterium]
MLKIERKKALWGFLVLGISLGLKAQHSKTYFQQTVNYDIQVELDDSNHFLNGYEELEYINNSHHGMDTLWFHLWPNAYKNNETALGKQLLENGSTTFQFIDKDGRGYIDSLNFKVNDKLVKWVYHPDYIDVCALILNKKLAPKERITISTPFRVKIPAAGISRLGHEGNSYQITQWYPKPAVFDKDGWHAMPYLNQGEFYSEFGTFDVRISVPKNYVIGATGELKTKSEIDFLSERANYSASTPLDEITFDSISSNEYKTLHFRQANLHDFAWFGQKDFMVLKDSVELPNSKRSVNTWAYFDKANYKEWKGVPRYINQAVYHYSKYNGDYPYKHCSAVEASLEAGGGMEYPMITIIDFGMTGKVLENVIVHEVGHNWFYGMLGFNERDMPSLDEGINSFYEMRYFEELYGDSSLSAQITGIPNFLNAWLALDLITVRGEKYFTYLFTARNNTDQKLTAHAADYTFLNYGAIVYAKMAVSLQMLRAALGTDVFDKSMRQFYSKWEFKHPNLQDLRAEFELVSGEDLSWFFDHYLNSTEKINIKLKKVKTKNDIHYVKVKNKSSLNIPVSISALDKDGAVLSSHKIKSLSGVSKIELANTGAKSIMVDSHLNTVEKNRKDNISRTKGILKKVEPLQLKFLGSLENSNKTQLFYLPMIGWNSSDQTMLGIGLHNKSILEKPFEFFVAPMYSIHRNQINGIYNADYHFYFSSFIKRLTLNGNLQRFSYSNPTLGLNSTQFERYNPKINFDFKNKNARSPWRNYLSIGTIYTTEHTNREGLAIVSDDNLYKILDWKSTRNRELSQSEINFTSTNHEDFQLIELVGTQNWKYHKGKENISLRMYAGVFANNQSVSPRYNLRMDGQRGWYDYTFSNVFLERGTSHDFWQQQMNDNQGGFKTPTNVGQSNNWLLAFNLNADLPLVLPIGIYSDIGTSSTESFMFNAGVRITVLRDIVEVFLPALWSDSIEQAYSANNVTYNEQIRFTLHLHKLNPYKALDGIVK